MDHRPTRPWEIRRHHLRKDIAAGERLDQSILIPPAEQDHRRVDEHARIDQVPAPQSAAVENGDFSPLVDDPHHFRHGSDSRCAALGLQRRHERIGVRTNPRLLGVDGDDDLRNPGSGFLRDKRSDLLRLVDPHPAAVEPARHGRLLHGGDLDRGLRHGAADQLADPQRPGSRRRVHRHPPGGFVERPGRAEDVQVGLSLGIGDRDLDREDGVDRLPIGAGHARPDVQIRSSRQPGVSLEHDLLDRRGQKRIHRARQVPQVCLERHPLVAGCDSHRLHGKHVVDVAGTGRKLERRNVRSLIERQGRPGESGRCKIRDDEVFPAAALEPIRADDPIVNRCRGDFLGEDVADDFRRLFRAVPDLASLKIDVPRKRPAEFVVVFVELGIQPHDPLDRQFTRLLDDHGLPGGDQFPQRREDRRRRLVLIGVAWREDDIVFRSLPGEQLAVVEKVGGKSRPQAGDPEAFRREFELVRLPGGEVGRLAGIIDRHPAVAAVEAGQEIPVGRQHSLREVPHGVAVVVGRRGSGIEGDVEIADALDVLGESQEGLPHEVRSINAARTVVVDLRPDRDVVPHPQYVGHQRGEHRPIPVTAVLIHHRRGHIE